MYYFFVFLILLPYLFFELSERFAFRSIRDELQGYEKYIFKKKIATLFPSKISDSYSWFYHIDWQLILEELNRKESDSLYRRLLFQHKVRKLCSALMWVLPVSVILYGNMQK